MAYLGTKPQSGFISQEANQYFTGLTQNFIDLNQSISSLSSVIVLVNGVVQENSDLTLTSSTRITLGATLVSADKVTCIYVAKISSTQAPATGSVTSDMLSGSIANSKLSNSSITLNGSAVSLGGSATVGGDNTPIFVATKGTNQTTVSDNVYTQVTYTNEVSDADSCFASSTFTAPSSGLYYFYASVTLKGHTAVSYHYVTQFYKNGSGLDDYRSTYMDDNAESQQFQCPISGIISLAQNDTIKVYAKVNTTSGDVAFLDGVFGGYKLIT